MNLEKLVKVGLVLITLFFFGVVAATVEKDFFVLSLFTVAALVVIVFNKTIFKSKK